MTKTMKSVILSIALIIIYSGCSRKVTHTQEIHSLTLEAGDISATFVDNEALSPDHKAGYNGIARLTHKAEPHTIYVPDYAGINLEHIFGGDSLVEIFEPRKYPMKLSREGANRVVLVQSPTPLSHVESKTVFELEPPHYINVEFECVIRNDEFFRHGYAGLFWASYILAPEDKCIYFIGTSGDDNRSGWIKAYSERHGLKSTHRSQNDKHKLEFADNFNPTLLVQDFSKYRYKDPFYYGRFRNMVLVYMFNNDKDIRFSQSPTGGGKLNPAWDFQFIISPFEVNKKYHFRARIVYKPFVSQKDIVEEFEKWQTKLNETEKR